MDTSQPEKTMLLALNATIQTTRQARETEDL